MMERSDRAPLLDWEEVPPAEKPGDAAAPPPAQANERLSSPRGSRAAPGSGWSSAPGGPAASGSDACSTAPAAPCTQEGGDPGAERSTEALGEDRMVKWEEKDQIVSVFVVTFNTRTGETRANCLPCVVRAQGESTPPKGAILPWLRMFVPRLQKSRRPARISVTCRRGYRCKAG